MLFLQLPQHRHGRFLRSSAQLSAALCYVVPFYAASPFSDSFHVFSLAAYVLLRMAIIVLLIMRVHDAAGLLRTHGIMLEHAESNKLGGERGCDNGSLRYSLFSVHSLNDESSSASGRAFDMLPIVILEESTDSEVQS